MPIDLAHLSDEQLEVAAACLQDYARWRKALAAQQAAAAEARRGRLQWQALSAALRLARNALDGTPGIEWPPDGPASGQAGATRARQWLAWFVEQARHVDVRVRQLTEEQARLGEAQAQKPPEPAAVANVSALSAEELEALNAQADALQAWQGQKRARAERLSELDRELSQLRQSASALEVVCQTLHTMPADLLQVLPAQKPAAAEYAHPAVPDDKPESAPAEPLSAAQARDGAKRQPML